MFAVALALNLEERLGSSTAAITVMGRPAIGLPLAVAFAERRHRVRLVNLEAERGAAWNAEGTYLRPTPPRRSRGGLAKRLEISAGTAAVAESDVTVISVPVPVTARREPDTSHAAEAARHVAAHLRPGHLVVCRSTFYPGMTEEIVRPILESTGLRVGQEIFLAFTPPRAGRGGGPATPARVPLVVGGCDRISTRLAVRLMQEVSPRVTPVSSPTAAEMVGLAEAVGRTVNVALCNRLAQLCSRMNLDVWEVTDAAGARLNGAIPFSPALVHERCAPRGPALLAWKASECRVPLDFVDLAARVNEEMPSHIVDRLLGVLDARNGRNGGLRVLVLGVASTDDEMNLCCAAALAVMGLLRQHGVQVLYHDPSIPEMRLEDGGDVLHSQPLTGSLLHKADCVLLLHGNALFDYQTIVRDARLVFDACNATGGLTAGREKIVRL